MKPNRRSFLKGVAAGAVSAAAGVDAQALHDGLAPAKDRGAASAKSSLELVNLLQGTGSTYLFSRGNTLPIAAMPFGMAHWTLQSNGQELAMVLSSGGSAH